MGKGGEERGGVGRKRGEENFDFAPPYLNFLATPLNISHQQYADDSQLYISLVADSIRASLYRFETCLSAVRSWFCTNGLCLNPDKSDSIILGTHQRLRTFPAIPAVKIADTDINISNEITSLGVIMDSKLTLDSHISAICKSCYYYLRSLQFNSIQTFVRCHGDQMKISVYAIVLAGRLTGPGCFVVGHWTL